MNSVLFTLLEAQVTLYVADAEDAPVQEIWSGVEAEQLVARETWLVAETRPTGRATPKLHPLCPRYQVRLGRVWALPLTQLLGFVPGRGRYILDIVWQDEDAGHWQRRTFYGVTINERSTESREPDTGFTENQVFDAEIVALSSSRDAAMAPEDVPSLLVDGATGSGDPAVTPSPPPPITSGPPLTYAVRYAAPGDQQLLYLHNATTGAFSEVNAAAAGQRALVRYESAAWVVRFPGANMISLAYADFAGDLAWETAGDGWTQKVLAVTPGTYFYAAGNAELATASAASGNVPPAETYAPGIIEIGSEGAFYLWSHATGDVTATLRPLVSVALIASGVFSATRFLSSPPASQWARLDFFCGGAWAASISQHGVVYAPAFKAASPRPGNAFLPRIGAAILASFSASGVQVGELSAFSPTQVTGATLLAWVESRALAEGPLLAWPAKAGCTLEPASIVPSAATYEADSALGSRVRVLLVPGERYRFVPGNALGCVDVRGANLCATSGGWFSAAEPICYIVGGGGQIGLATTATIGRIPRVEFVDGYCAVKMEAPLVSPTAVLSPNAGMLEAFLLCKTGPQPLPVPLFGYHGDAPLISTNTYVNSGDQALGYVGFTVAPGLYVYDPGNAVQASTGLDYSEVEGNVPAGDVYTAGGRVRLTGTAFYVWGLCGETCTATLRRGPNTEWEFSLANPAAQCEYAVAGGTTAVGISEEDHAWHLYELRSDGVDFLILRDTVPDALGSISTEAPVVARPIVLSGLAGEPTDTGVRGALYLRAVVVFSLPLSETARTAIRNYLQALYL